MNFTSIGQINHITQCCNQKLKQIENSDAMMVYVLNGEKHVECSGEHFIVKAGQLIVIPANMLMNVTNLSINDQQYQALCFTWCSELLHQFALSHLPPKTIMLNKISVQTQLTTTFIERLKQIENELLTEDFNNSSTDLTLVKHFFYELLIRLSAMHIAFMPPKPDKLSQKIRRVIGMQPSKKWYASELAKQFALSESTLRRHLALEGYNLSQIILDVRLSYGLMLLQTSQKSILQISQAIGYESGSRFAFYFKKRFGFSPKQLRR